MTEVDPLLGRKESIFSMARCKHCSKQDYKRLFIQITMKEGVVSEYHICQKCMIKTYVCSNHKKLKTSLKSEYTNPLFCVCCRFIMGEGQGVKQSMGFHALKYRGVGDRLNEDALAKQQEFEGKYVMSLYRKIVREINSAADGELLDVMEYKASKGIRTQQLCIVFKKDFEYSIRIREFEKILEEKLSNEFKETKLAFMVSLVYFHEKKEIKAIVYADWTMDLGKKK